MNNREQEAKDWAVTYTFDMFYAEDSPPEKFPVDSKIFFADLQASGNDAKYFKAARTTAETEWARLHEKAEEDWRKRSMSSHYGAFADDGDDVDFDYRDDGYSDSFFINRSSTEED